MVDYSAEWPSIDSYNDLMLGNYLIPGTRVSLLLYRPSAPIFVAFAAEYNVLVEALDHVPNDNYGFEPRNIAGTNTPSKHHKGTAIDLAATRFPSHTSRMTNAQLNTMHRLISKYKVLEWGGDWSLIFLDQMHIQLKQNPNGSDAVSQADVQAAIKKLGLGVPVALSPAEITAIAHEVWINTTVSRVNAHVPAIQELADSKSFSYANGIKLDHILSILSEIPPVTTPGSPPVSITLSDTDIQKIAEVVVALQGKKLLSP